MVIPMTMPIPIQLYVIVVSLSKYYKKVETYFMLQCGRIEVADLMAFLLGLQK
jgi:hypothetical protein